MDIQQLKFFLAVVDHNGFNAALTIRLNNRPRKVLGCAELGLDQ